MKRTRSFLLVLIILLIAGLFPVFVIADAPVRINTAEDLFALMKKTGQFSDWAGSYLVTDDIDMTGVQDQSPIGNVSTLFAGTFDGGGHTISGIKITGKDGNGTGLFGAVASCTIKDLCVSGTVQADGKQRVGGLVGSVDPNHANSVNRVDDNSTGGVCNILNCVNNINVTGKTRVGGILGIVILNNATNYSFELNVRNCINKGSVTGTDERIGGVVGSASPAGDKGRVANISNCVNEGDVSGKMYVGGIIGNADTNPTNLISNCVNNGHIVLEDTDGTGGTKYGVGGIAGRITAFVIDSCVNNGTVEMKAGVSNNFDGFDLGSCAGGIAGRMENYSEVRNCVNFGTVIDAYAGGIGGIVGSSSMTTPNNTVVVENCLNAGVIMPGGKENERNVIIGEIIGANTAGSFSDCFYIVSDPRKAKNNGVGEEYSESKFTVLNSDGVWVNPAKPTINGAGTSFNENQETITVTEESSSMPETSADNDSPVINPGDVFPTVPVICICAGMILVTVVIIVVILKKTKKE